MNQIPNGKKYSGNSLHFGEFPLKRFLSFLENTHGHLGRY